MKLHGLLIILALGMAFAMGYSVFKLQGSLVYTRSNLLEVRTLEKNFTNRVKPLMSIKMDIFLRSKENLQLIHPASHSANKELIERFSSSKDCLLSQAQVGKFKDWDEVKKTVRWEEFRCGLIDKLSPTFFLSPPYIHPEAGVSYVYLAYKSKRAEFQKKEWLQRFIGFVHVKELREFPLDEIRLPKEYYVLKNLDDGDLWDMVREKRRIVTSHYYMVKQSGPATFFYPTYIVYNFQEFKDYIVDSSYNVRLREKGMKCLIPDGQLCWNYNFRDIFGVLSKTALASLALGIIIVFVVIIILFSRLRSHRLEDDRRKLALRTLTHELRTPVASMILNLENLGRDLASFDDKQQEHILKMSNDAYRLKRLVDLSRHYINVKNTKGIIAKDMIQSYNIEDLLFKVEQDYPELKLQIEAQGEICVDEYWFQVCLKNLIENAYRHGEPEVELRVYSLKKNIIFEVQDQGNCQFDRLDEITQEFVKGNKSEGSGLGLNIVQTVINEMNAKLEFEKNPTRFRMIFSQRKNNE